MSLYDVKDVVYQRRVARPFAWVGDGLYSSQKLFIGDVLTSNIGPSWYVPLRHRHGYQVRDPANPTTAYDLEGQLLYMINAGDRAEGATWPVGWSNCRIRKEEMAWCPNAEYIVSNGCLAVRIIRDLRPNDQVLVHNYMVGTN